MWFSQLALTFVAMWWDRCFGCRLTLRTSQARTPALWWPACYRSEPSGSLSLSLSHGTERVGCWPARAHSLVSPQKVSYKAKRWIYDVRTIAEVEGTGVKAWRRAQWQEQILVPALPQSALPGCSLIHIDYYLQVWCCPGLGGLRLGALGLTPQCLHSF